MVRGTWMNALSVVRSFVCLFGCLVGWFWTVDCFRFYGTSIFRMNRIRYD